MNITKRQAAIARKFLGDEKHALFAMQFATDTSFYSTCKALAEMGASSRDLNKLHDDHQLRTALAFIVTLGEDK